MSDDERALLLSIAKHLIGDRDNFDWCNKTLVDVLIAHDDLIEGLPSPATPEIKTIG